jgi:hypothetical protein
LVEIQCRLVWGHDSLQVTSHHWNEVIQLELLGRNWYASVKGSWGYLQKYESILNHVLQLWLEWGSSGSILCHSLYPLDSLGEAILSWICSICKYS